MRMFTWLRFSLRTGSLGCYLGFSNNASIMLWEVALERTSGNLFFQDNT